MSISLIVAMDKNRVIGKNNTIPWMGELPSDLQYFKRMTEGHTIIMGRKTFESLPEPLFNRYHVVLTTQKSYQFAHPSVVVSNDIMLTIELAQKSPEEIFVIGGGEIFNLFMPYANKMYVTEIEHEFEGDTKFPIIQESQWRKESITFGKQTDRDKYPFNFLAYERR